MTRSRLEDRLAAIAAVAADPDAAGAEATLRAAVRSTSGVAVAAAARVVAAQGRAALLDELPAAFARLVERPVERDPGCRGKLAIVRALEACGRYDDDVLARAVRHVQPEPVWGGREDTAGELRGVAALAYAHAGHPDALDVAAELLADPERIARVAAAHALGDSGRLEATAPLRLRARLGDPEPEVLAACFGALLALAPEAARPFVEGFLAGEPDAAEVAALALGESRLAAATPALRAWCDALPEAARIRVGYLALALGRDDAAVRHLLEVIAAGEPADAVGAVRALATFREDAALAGRVRAAAARRRDGAATAAVAAAFG